MSDSVSIEAYFVASFAMEAFLMALSISRVGPVRPGRIALAAAFGAVGSLAVSAGFLPIPCAPPLMLAGLAFASDKRSFPSLMKAMAWYLMMSCSLAGFALLVRARLGIRLTLPELVGAAAFAFGGLLVASQGDRGDIMPQMRLRIETDRGFTQLSALVDTGNRLCEPFSGQPVVIVSRRCLRSILPQGPGENAVRAGTRLVFYQTFGGSGQMHCFKPKSLLVRRKGRWTEVPDIWIAVYPGRIPGGLDAVAPPAIQGR